LSTDDVQALEKLCFLSRNWEIRHSGTRYTCEILADVPPSLREGVGETIAEAVNKAIEDLRKQYV